MSLGRRYKPNPDYGSGIYRRRIDLRAAGDAVEARIIDIYHEMACVIRHDGRAVTGIEGSIIRAPFSTCAAAPAALQELVGIGLDTVRREIYGGGRARRNCTHLFDIAALAIGLALTGEPERRFDFVVPDENERGMLVDALVDGGLVHQWLLKDEVILAPAEMAGRPLFGGFAAWALDRFEGAALDAAYHLQKAVFVARGRRFELNDPSAGSIRDEPERSGVCYTFSEPQFSTAQESRDYSRDFARGLPER